MDHHRQTGKHVAFIVAIILGIMLQGVFGSVSFSTLDPVLKKTVRVPHTFEVKDKDKLEQITKSKLPKLVIIIDDIGYDRNIAENFFNLNVALTFSMFPHTPMSKDFIERIRFAGSEVMLHLPMEPIEYPEINPGPEAIFSYMTEQELIQQVKKNLDSVPMISGVNNHMGSKITRLFPHMYQVLSIIKQRRLFFIDSVTTDDSICQTAARLLRVPFAKRDVFLDHIQEYGFIKNQLGLLVQLSKKYGEAVGICHPHTVTYQVLKKELPQISKQVQFVPASKVVHTTG